MSGLIYSTDQSAKILLKTKYTPRDVARFVIKSNIQHYYIAKDELKVHMNKNGILLDSNLSPTEKNKTKHTTNI